MAGVSEQNISDDRLVAATGKPRAAWHALLDAEGATSWAHPQIARWLVETHGVDGWWAQGVTVGYEQDRGMRMPGQLADGTSVLATVSPGDGGKSRVALTRSKLADAGRLGPAKRELADVLDALASSVNRSVD